jgi:hypothetical protein
MDILASIFAYLGSIIGIFGALAITFLVFLGPHQHQSANNIQHTAAIAANAGASHSTPVAQTQNKPVKVEQQEVRNAPSASPAAAPQADTPQATPMPTNPLMSLRHKEQLASRAQNYRRLVEEERARRWAYQQDPSFEARFLGYAD